MLMRSVWRAASARSGALRRGYARARADGGSPDGGSFKGHADVGRLFGQRWEVLEDVSFEPERFEELDDETVLVMVRVKARGRQSGVPIDQYRANLWRLREGVPMRVDVFESREEALAATEGSTGGG
jgi:hypothetical protein